MLQAKPSSQSFNCNSPGTAQRKILKREPRRRSIWQHMSRRKLKIKICDVCPSACISSMRRMRCELATRLQTTCMHQMRKFTSGLWRQLEINLNAEVMAEINFTIVGGIAVNQNQCVHSYFMPFHCHWPARSAPFTVHLFKHNKYSTRTWMRRRSIARRTSLLHAAHRHIRRHHNSSTVNTKTTKTTTETSGQKK